MGKRITLQVVLCEALCVMFCTFVYAYAQNDGGCRARQIFELTNRDRVNHDLPALRWDASLAAAAQVHAERMAAENSLSHQYPGEKDLSARAAVAGAHFQAIAENIATGYSDQAIEEEWMNSIAHRANILDPRTNSLGVGAVAKGGIIYAVEDFEEAAEALSVAQVESRVGMLLRGKNIDPSGSRDVAVLACSSAGGFPAVDGKLMVRFDTPDLSRLPSQVAAQLQSGNYHRAAVAACSPGGENGGFTIYRVAIVLY